MLKAYVGVASKHGLSLFQPERADALMLVRRCMRSGLRRVGFGAYLHETEATSIQTLFHNGHRQEAMAALEHCAEVIGPILPSDPNLHPAH